MRRPRKLLASLTCLVVAGLLVAALAPVPADAMVVQKTITTYVITHHAQGYWQHHDGYYYQVQVSAAWTEQVLVSPASTQTQQVLDQPGYYQDVLVTAAWTEHVLVTPGHFEMMVLTPAWDETVTTTTPEYTSSVWHPGWMEQWIISDAWVEIIYDPDTGAHICIYHPTVYGQIWHPDWTEYIYHPPVTTTTIVHHPEVDYLGRTPDVYQDVYHPAVYQQQWVPPVYHTVTVTIPAKYQTVDHPAVYQTNYSPPWDQWIDTSYDTRDPVQTVHTLTLTGTVDQPVYQVGDTITFTAHTGGVVDNSVVTVTPTGGPTLTMSPAGTDGAYQLWRATWTIPASTAPSPGTAAFWASIEAAPMTDAAPYSIVAALSVTGTFNPNPVQQCIQTTTMTANTTGNPDTVWLQLAGGGNYPLQPSGSNTWTTTIPTCLLTIGAHAGTLTAYKGTRQAQGSAVLQVNPPAFDKHVHLIQ